MDEEAEDPDSVLDRLYREDYDAYDAWKIPDSIDSVAEGLNDVEATTKMELKFSADGISEISNQVFVKNNVPSGLAYLMKILVEEEPEIVKYFLLKTLHLQGQASSMVQSDLNLKKDILALVHYLGTVAPVESGLCWIILLNFYTMRTQDYTLCKVPDVKTAIRHIVNLLCADGSNMIDRGILGTPMDIHGILFIALICAKQMVKNEQGGEELVKIIDNKIRALSSHCTTEEYFHFITENVPYWLIHVMDNLSIIADCDQKPPSSIEQITPDISISDSTNVSPKIEYLKNNLEKSIKLVDDCGDEISVDLHSKLKNGLQNLLKMTNDSLHSGEDNECKALALCTSQEINTMAAPNQESVAVGNQSTDHLRNSGRVNASVNRPRGYIILKSRHMRILLLILMAVQAFIMEIDVQMFTKNASQNGVNWKDKCLFILNLLILLLSYSIHFCKRRRPRWWDLSHFTVLDLYNFGIFWFTIVAFLLSLNEVVLKLLPEVAMDLKVMSFERASELFEVFACYRGTVDETRIHSKTV